MPKPDKKSSVNKGKQAQPPKKAAEEGGSFINFGAITGAIGGLTNAQVAGILKSSQQFLKEGNPDLTSDPKFLKDLDAYATEKSVEIMNSSFNNIPSTSGPQPPRPGRVPIEPIPRLAAAQAPTKAPAPPPAQKPKAPAPPPQASVQKVVPVPLKNFARPQVVRDDNVILVNRDLLPLQRRTPSEHVPKILGRWKKPQKKPQTMNTAFYSPGDKPPPPSAEEMVKRLLKEKRNRLDQNAKWLVKRPEEIAREIMKPKFNDSFVFKLVMHISNTGMSQNLSFVFVGNETYTTFKSWFRKKYMQNFNFKMFYQNHDGRYFEVHDNRTFKMMLITQGAFPRGIHCNCTDGLAKMFCVPISEFAENGVSYFLRDLVFGMDQEILNHKPDTLDFLYRLHSILAPDYRYAALVNQVFEYTENDLKREGNCQNSIVQVMYWVQRKLLAKEFFEDRGTEEVTMDELELLLETRYSCPYLEKSAAESLHVEIDVILDALHRSRHQTKQGIDAAYSTLKNEASRIIAEKKEREIKNAYATQEQIWSSIRNIEAQMEKPANVVAPPVRLQDMRHHRNCEPSGFKEFTVEHKVNPNPGPFVEVRRNTKVLEDPTGRGLSAQEVMKQSSQFVQETGVPGFQALEKPREEEQFQRTLKYVYHPQAAENENEAKEYLNELNEIVEKKKEAQKSVVNSDLERARKELKERQEKICIDELVGEDDGPDLKTIDEDDEISSQEPSPILQDQPKMFVLFPARVESSEDEECPDLMERGSVSPIKCYRAKVPDNGEENQLERFPSQENVTITHECLDEEKISKTIIKVGMDKPKPQKEPTMHKFVDPRTGQTIAEIRPSVIKSSISQEEEFMTPLGSVSTPPEGFLRSGVLENAAEEDIETFQDCEEELHTPTKQIVEEKPPVPTSAVPDLNEDPPASPVKQNASPTRETSSPIVSVKLSVAGSSSPTKKVSPDSLKSLDSPALSSFTSTSEILQQTFSLLSKPAAKTATPFESSLQKLAKEKADAVEDITGKSSKPEDPSLSKVQTEEELKAQEAEQKAKTPTTPKSQKLKTS
ncbi:unnamed protein product [Caenorhabditis brenneri]